MIDDEKGVGEQLASVALSIYRSIINIASGPQFSSIKSATH